MALPSTGAITLSAVNTELGRSDTSTLALNDGRVRSLANTSVVSDSTFSMSSLANKSGTWISGTWDRSSPSRWPALFQGNSRQFFYGVSTGTTALGTGATFAIEQYNLNGESTNVHFCFRPTEIATSGGTFNSTITNVSPDGSHTVTMFRYAVGTSRVNGLAKINLSSQTRTTIEFRRLLNQSGSALSGIGILGSLVILPTGNVAVGFNAFVENFGGVTIADTFHILVFDANLQFSFGRYWAGFRGSPDDIDRDARIAGCDSSGNLYGICVVQTRTTGTSTPTSLSFAHFKISSTGVVTQGALQHAADDTVDSSYSAVNVSSSGKMAVIIPLQRSGVATSSARRPVAVIFNSNGSVQFTRQITTGFGTNIVYTFVNAVFAGDGSIYLFASVGARAGSTPATGGEVHIIKLDSSGTTIWQRRIRFSVFGNARPYVDMSTDGRPVLCGENENLLSFDCLFGDFDQYSIPYVEEACNIVVRTDGSGTGTYFHPNSYDMIYDVSTVTLGTSFSLSATGVTLPNSVSTTGVSSTTLAITTTTRNGITNKTKVNI